ncbi:hypothetical protein BO99DRAFT_226550 [Aspergillus violaceofuscus CBS 115571]|uniref:Uncharacterized protein n=1 Tax=Aspergillus violaceofuscus (strain CBS 115571) TaxID=1450538 RepID=A0A2V5H690_ASPV1|nr:hypothetical protein BO99DRAFT_226550 [Aspergillus violaceofuscus CBS 115571]
MLMIRREPSHAYPQAQVASPPATATSTAPDKKQTRCIPPSFRQVFPKAKPANPNQIITIITHPKTPSIPVIIMQERTQSHSIAALQPTPNPTKPALGLILHHVSIARQASHHITSHHPANLPHQRQKLLEIIHDQRALDVLERLLVAVGVHQGAVLAETLFFLLLVELILEGLGGGGGGRGGGGGVVVVGAEACFLLVWRALGGGGEMEWDLRDERSVEARTESDSSHQGQIPAAGFLEGGRVDVRGAFEEGAGVWGGEVHHFV